MSRFEIRYQGNADMAVAKWDPKEGRGIVYFEGVGQCNVQQIQETKRGWTFHAYFPPLKPVKFFFARELFQLHKV